jgi:hypothetical protein
MAANQDSKQSNLTRRVSWCSAAQILGRTMSGMQNRVQAAKAAKFEPVPILHV